MMIHLTSELPLLKPYLLGLLTGVLGAHLIRLTRRSSSRLIKSWAGIISMQGSCRDLTAPIRSIFRRVRSVVSGPDVIK
jgi:hypothetical protein